MLKIAKISILCFKTSIDEADTLLSSNKTNAIKSLEEVKEQLGNFFNFLIPTLSEGLREIKNSKVRSY